MIILTRIFTWWKVATVGTWLMTMFRGQEVGTDQFGNRYYTERKSGKRRWVIYKDEIEASSVPAEWNAWLHHTTDKLPSATAEKRDWEREHKPNLTGTAMAYHPAGSVETGGRRHKATGDYEPWQPS